MRRLRKGRGATAAAVGVVAALVAGGGYALASSSGAVFHGCANKRTGALRLARQCSKRERAVAWNARGLQGAQGLQGPQFEEAADAGVAAG